jgi:hypothetical protein
MGAGRTTVGPGVGTGEVVTAGGTIIFGAGAETTVRGGADFMLRENGSRFAAGALAEGRTVVGFAIETGGKAEGASVVGALNDLG